MSLKIGFGDEQSPTRRNDSPHGSLIILFIHYKSCRDQEYVDFLLIKIIHELIVVKLDVLLQPSSFCFSGIELCTTTEVMFSIDLNYPFII